MDTPPYPMPGDDGYWPPTIVPDARRLTRRQEMFCQAFAVMGSAARAARAAGYSERSARQQAWRLLQTERIRARLARIHADIGRDFKDSLNVYIGKLELAYRQAIEDRRSLAAVRAVLAQAHLAVLRRKLEVPPDDIEAVQRLNAAIRERWIAERERQRERGQADADAWLRRDHDDAATTDADAGDDMALTKDDGNDDE